MTAELISVGTEILTAMPDIWQKNVPHWDWICIIR